MKRIPSAFWLFLCLLVGNIVSCGDKQHAGGTASEGESFVYGYIHDSTLAFAKLRQGNSDTPESTLVILARMAYADTGIRFTWSESTYADIDGFFSIPVRDTGEYILISHGPNGLASIYNGIQVHADSVNLGNLGIYQPYDLQGLLPSSLECSGEIRVTIPGFGSFPYSTSDSSYLIEDVPQGDNSILMQCRDTIMEWDIDPVNSCSVVTLDSLLWLELDQYDSLASQYSDNPEYLDSLYENTDSGAGFEWDPAYDWHWLTGSELYYDDACGYTLP